MPALGLTAGKRYHASTHGMMGFAVLSSRSVREALEVGIRYFRLSFTFTDMRLEPVGDDLRVVLDDSETPSDVRPFLTERDVAAVGTMQLDMIGFALPALEVQIAGPDHGYPRALRGGDRQPADVRRRGHLGGRAGAASSTFLSHRRTPQRRAL